MHNFGVEIKNVEYQYFLTPKNYLYISILQLAIKYHAKSIDTQTVNDIWEEQSAVSEECNQKLLIQWSKHLVCWRQAWLVLDLFK